MPSTLLSALLGCIISAQANKSSGMDLLDFKAVIMILVPTAATHEFEEAEELLDSPWSQNCNRMVDIISSKNMSQPKKATNKNN
jgi:hypothetical protein